MAIFNEILAGRYNRALQKLLSMKGAPPSRQLAGEIMAVIQLMHGRENRYLEDWKAFGGSAGVAAVAAQNSTIRLNNPAGSGIIAVVEGTKLSTSVANAETVLQYGFPGGGNLAALQIVAALDPRQLGFGTGSGGTALQLSTANNVPVGNHIPFDDVRLSSASNTSNEIINFENQEVVLLPNTDLQWQTLTVNTDLKVSVRWRERPLEDSEKF